MIAHDETLITKKFYVEHAIGLKKSVNDHQKRIAFIPLEADRYRVLPVSTGVVNKQLLP